MSNNPTAVDPALQDPRTPLLVWGGTPSQDQRSAILIEAYKKHSAELLAIENSQAKLQLLVLTIYASAITLVGTLRHDGSQISWYLISALSVSALLLAFYAWRMGQGRNRARKSVRIALVQVDCALGFFENGIFLKDKALYPQAWKGFATMRTFLDSADWVIVIAAAAFIAIIVGARFV